MNRATWNPAWDDIFSKSEWGKYPCEELIRFVARRYYGVRRRKDVSFLDVGCGAGSSSWYLARENFNVTAIDGSIVGLGCLRERLVVDGLYANTILADLADLPFENDYFDCALEVHSLMCNTTSATKLIINEIFRTLKPGGLFFSRTPSTEGWNSLNGPKCEKNTFSHCTDGPFVGMGTVRLTEREEIEHLYHPFQIESLDRSFYTEANESDRRGFWTIILRKP